MRVRRVEGDITAEQVSPVSLRACIAHAARFTQNHRFGTREVDPSLALAGNILARESWPFPHYRGLVRTPTLRPDGSLIDKPGYDEASGLIYSPSDESIASIRVPEHPTTLDIRQASELLLGECLGDFPFANQSSQANALALLLTPLVRPAVGCVPLAVVTSPVPGTGKGLLCDTVATIITGSDAPKIPYPESPEEFRKAITSILLGPATYAVFDNIDVPIRSANLAALITARHWSDRLLGASRQVCLANLVTWAVTGNQAVIAGDMRRRCFRIELDAACRHPEFRTGFRHRELLSWVTTNRGRLLGAALTLVRAYISRGFVRSMPMLGSFESWCLCMGGILRVAGVSGFLDDCTKPRPGGPVPVPPKKDRMAATA